MPLQILLKGRQAVGVEYVRNHTTLQVRARKEVILSAGTVGSAKLLLLSGIGPKDQLKALDVRLEFPFIVHLPF